MACSVLLDNQLPIQTNLRFDEGHSGPRRVATSVEPSPLVFVGGSTMRKRVFPVKRTIVALQTGEPLSLIYGKDYNGNVCGDGDYVNARFTTYPRLNEDLLVAAANGAGECNAICNTKRAHKEVWEVEATGGTSPLLSQLQGNLQDLGRFLNDMYAARSVVLLVGGLGALILGLLWLVVLQFFAGCVVWLTCSLVLIGDENTKLQFKSAAYVSWVVTTVVLLLIISMRKRLKVAIAIIRESSNLGSLCFGSFIIAFVQLLRIMLEYLDRNTKQIQQTNRVVRVVLLTVKCCLWCFEKCIKFLSKNAYILIAMKGSSFCTASARSFKLIFKNMARVAVVNSISFFLLFLIKMTVTLAVGLVVFALLSKSSSLSLSAEQLSLLGGATVTSPLAPAVVACVLAWLVASAFVNVYDTAIDTILLCFCEDTELHGETASEFMSKELQHIMGGSVPSIGDKNQLIHVSSKGEGKNSSPTKRQSIPDEETPIERMDDIDI
ncbi:hypothetical protein PInf_001375 [Phytophthora infestans]|nr:hypothetical protein PInf_001375 [Phytophthora infestans]